MSSVRNHGATLIELLITSAIVSIILSAVYMIWSANIAAARQCQSIARDIHSSQGIINDLERQLANLVITKYALPLELERHSGKVIIRLHTRFDTQHDTVSPYGPFVAEYELDIVEKTMKYRQQAALIFDGRIKYDLPWQLTRTNISNIELEIFNSTKWTDIEQKDGMSDSYADIRSVRIKWEQTTTNGQSKYVLATEISTEVI